MLLSIIIFIFVKDEVLGQFPESCGERRQATKIVNGEEAYLGQFPWIARLHAGYVDSEFCGGVIITDRFVLTAAHCIGSSKVFVRLGDNFSKRLACEGDVCAPKTQNIAAKPYVHPNYNTKTHMNDIALLKLANKIKFNEFVQPACMPVQNVFKEKQTGEVEVAGWGLIDRKEQHFPQKLLYVNLKITNMLECKRLYGSGLNSETQYCVGGYDGKDSCGGDSGGPMTKAYKTDDKIKHFVIGLVSYGLVDCGQGPAIYTNVQPYLRWIKQVMKYY